MLITVYFSYATIDIANNASKESILILITMKYIV